MKKNNTNNLPSDFFIDFFTSNLSKTTYLKNTFTYLKRVLIQHFATYFAGKRYFLRCEWFPAVWQQLDIEEAVIIVSQQSK